VTGPEHDIDPAAISLPATLQVPVPVHVPKPYGHASEE
jgi:hypothetical protein